MLIPSSQGITCSNVEVLAYCEAELWNISPYSQPDRVLGGREMFEEARRRFGDLACDDLLYWLH